MHGFIELCWNTRLAGRANYGNRMCLTIARGKEVEVRGRQFSF